MTPALLAGRPRPQPPNALRQLGFVTWAAALALVAGAGLFLARDYQTPVGLSWGFRGSVWPLPVAFSTVGVLISSRLPRHPIGWLFHCTGLGFAIQAFVEEYAIFALQAHPGALPAGQLAAWIDNWIWIVSFWPALMSLFLFPDGRPLSRRWRLALAVLAVAVLALVFQYAFQSGPMQSSFPIENPYGLASPLIHLAAVVGDACLAAAILAAAASVGLRLWRSQGIQREQMKWLGFAAGLTLLIGPVSAGLGSSTPAAVVVTLLALLSAPVAVGIAILRYRLYDIDLIIRRTLVYTVLTAALALVYFGTVVLLQALFRSATRETSQLAIVASTLTIAALFSPLRRRVQDFIDRRFYRRKYDAAQALAEFAATARDETDLDRLTARLVNVVEETVQPAYASLWLAPQGPSAAQPRVRNGGKE